MATKADLKQSPIVAELYRLDAEIARLEARKAVLEAELIDEGEGHYLELEDLTPGVKRKAIVVVPSAPKPSYTLYPDAAKKLFLEERKAKRFTPALLKEFSTAQEEAARKISGDHFPALFDRIVIFQPATGFADLIPRLMPNAPATGLKLFKLCQVTKAAGKSHVKLPDRPKVESAESDDEE
jgi:hypothetical protein